MYMYSVYMCPIFQKGTLPRKTIFIKKPLLVRYCELTITITETSFSKVL